MASFATVISLAVVSSAEASKPHVLFLLADDYGWNNIGTHTAAPEVTTPFINSLAADGVELNRHYTFKFCSPSRSSLQSGRLPVHVNVLNAAPESYNPQDQVSGYAGIPVNMTCIAQKMRGAGYVTS